jgi:hypothetical protein
MARLVWALGCAAAGLFALVAAPLCARVEGGPVASYVLGYGAVVVQITLAAALRARVVGRGPWTEGALLGAAAIALLLVHGLPASPAPAALLSAALLLVASALGAILGRHVAEPGHVLAVALMSGLMDLWSVLDPGGPSARIAADVAAEPSRLSAFILGFPALGSGAPTPLVGGGDALFAALYAAALARHGVAERRALAALVLGFAAGMLTTLAAARPIPLLPFLGAAVVLCDGRLRSLGARDRRTVAVGVGLVLVWVASRIAR